MSGAFDLQRDLELIQGIVDRGIAQIEAVRHAAEAATKGQEIAPAHSAQSLAKAGGTPPRATDLDEDDYYQFRRFRT